MVLRLVFSVFITLLLMSAVFVGGSNLLDQSAFDFQISKRTLDFVRALLHEAKFPCLQLSSLFVSHVGAMSMRNASQIRLLQFAQLQTAHPAVTMIYAGSEDGMFIGFNVTNNRYQYILLENGTASCESNGEVLSPGRKSFFVDNTTGEPLSSTPSRCQSYDPRVRPWYTACKSRTAHALATVLSQSSATTTKLVLSPATKSQPSDNNNFCSDNYKDHNPHVTCKKTTISKTATETVAVVSANMIRKLINEGSGWSEIYAFASSGQLGTTFSAPIFRYNETDQSFEFVGATAANLGLTDLASFLYKEYKTEQDQRIVFIMDAQGYLVASSMEPTVFIASTQTFANASSAALIRSAAIHLQSISQIDSTKLVINSGRSIQASRYTDIHVGIDWIVVVTRPTQTIPETMSHSSPAFIALATTSSIVSLTSIVLVVWVVRYRKLHIWRAAQPNSLLLILFSNLLCTTTTFVRFGGSADDTLTVFTCMWRVWWIVIAVTLTFVGLIVKVFRAYLLLTTINHSFWFRQLIMHHTWVVVCGVMLVQIFVLVVWTVVDPMVPTTTFFETSNTSAAQAVATQTTTCKSKSLWGVGTVGVVLAVIFVTGCFVSYKSRKVSAFFAEGKALMIVFYHGTFLLILFAGIGFAAKGSISQVGNNNNNNNHQRDAFSSTELSMFLVIACCWFSLSIQAMLFLPRIYQQITQGDLTADQVKEIARKDIRAHQHAFRIPNNNAVPEEIVSTESHSRVAN